MSEQKSGKQDTLGLTTILEIFTTFIRDCRLNHEINKHPVCINNGDGTVTIFPESFPGGRNPIMDSLETTPPPYTIRYTPQTTVLDC